MKIAIYSRKSKYTGKGDSIGNQIQMCKDYIETHYRNNDPEYIIYEDEGFSGGNINRPKFQKLLSDIKKEKFDILICYRLDSFTIIHCLIPPHLLSLSPLTEVGDSCSIVLLY